MPRIKLSRLFVLLICALFLQTALAQVRQIPAYAKRGHFTHIQGPIVAIDGERMQLSAGAQIRGVDNLIIVPMSMPAGALVKYTLDGMGQIHRVWVLTPQEAAARDMQPK